MSHPSPTNQSEAHSPTLSEQQVKPPLAQPNLSYPDLSNTSFNTSTPSTKMSTRNTSPSQNASSSSSPQSSGTSAAAGGSYQSSAPSSSVPSKAAIDQDAKIRNAAAQARHRQKRKAHIAQMEQTLVQLQERLRTSDSDARLKQLQEENERLRWELQQLRAQMAASNYGGSDDGYSSSPPSSNRLIGGWLSSQGASQSANAYSGGSAPHFTTRPGYFPPGVAQSYVRQTHPVIQQTAHQPDYYTSDYDLPMPEGFEDLEVCQPRRGGPSAFTPAGQQWPNVYNDDQDPNMLGLSAWNPNQRQ
ncbi:hypothetical protein FRB96_009016 [Tulasnella sp. 330]|nr:hypothetical protein FRB96_009016 [Tulasnella sp. 330]